MELHGILWLATAIHMTLYAIVFNVIPCIVLQQSSNKALSFRDGPTGGTSFVNIYQNIRLDP